MNITAEGGVWVVTGAYCFGIAAALVCSNFTIVIAVALVALLLGTVTALLRASEYWIVVALSLVLLSMAMLRTVTQTPVRSVELDASVNGALDFTGLVVEEPDIRTTSTNLTVSVERASSTRGIFSSPRQRILVSVGGAHTHIAYGDRVDVRGTIKLPQEFSQDDGREFNYPRYLSAQGIGYTMSFASVHVRESGNGNFFKAFLLRTKEYFLQLLADVYPEPQGSLAGGLLVGDKRGLGAAVTQEFKTDGISHIIVLSGYNISVIARIAFDYFGIISIALGNVVSMVSVVAIVLMSGAAASAVRAGVMAAVVICARIVRRPYAAGRALAFSIVCMLFYNPRILLGDPGFALSVIATLGLVYMTPVVQPFVQWIHQSKYVPLRETLETTIGAQLAVLPLQKNPQR